MLINSRPCKRDSDGEHVSVVLCVGLHYCILLSFCHTQPRISCFRYSFSFSHFTLRLSTPLKFKYLHSSSHLSGCSLSARRPSQASRVTSTSRPGCLRGCVRCPSLTTLVHRHSSSRICTPQAF